VLYEVHSGTFLQQSRKFYGFEYFKHGNLSAQTIKDCMLFPRVLPNGRITGTHYGWSPQIFITP
jgi:hypothetical protein